MLQQFWKCLAWLYPYVQDVVFGNEFLARGLHLKSACLSVNTFAWYLKNI